jgi:ethanolamine ammonia-lyase small subunit
VSTRQPRRLDPWQALRALTPARIALGRAGAALPTEEVLRFGVAHAQARDAVHEALDVAALAKDLQSLGLAPACVKSQAPDRAGFLLRPDLGRRLRPAGADALRAQANQRGKRQATSGLCLVLADGLSARALQRHAPPLLAEFLRIAGERFGPTTAVIAEQARVALGDEIGECLAARVVAVLIGERPGLSSPDSLGIYLTFAPRVGRSDAERNCLSNIRPQGMPPAEAARRLAWLIDAALRLQLTGVALKDGSDAAPGLVDRSLPTQD